jgi:hypothetical protein
MIFPLKRYLGTPFTVRLSAENILNQPYHSTQGDELQRLYTTGVKFTLGFSYAFSGGEKSTSPSSGVTEGGTSGGGGQ